MAAKNIHIKTNQPYLKTASKPTAPLPPPKVQPQLAATTLTTIPDIKQSSKIHAYLYSPGIQKSSKIQGPGIKSHPTNAKKAADVDGLVLGDGIYEEVL